MQIESYRVGEVGGAPSTVVGGIGGAPSTIVSSIGGDKAVSFADANGNGSRTTAVGLHGCCLSMAIVVLSALTHRHFWESYGFHSLGDLGSQNDIRSNFF